MVYDLAKIRSQGIPAESLQDWVMMTTERDVCSAYRMAVAFYQRWGFDVFWAYKDQQWLASHPTVLSEAGKRQYIQNLLNNPPVECEIETTSLREKLVQVFSHHPQLFTESEPTPEGEEPEETDGEFGLIRIDGTDYEFRLDELANFVGDEVYEWGWDDDSDDRRGE